MMLSVVVPMYNEQESLPHFAQRLRPVLDTLSEAYEVLCVDDCSTDGTADSVRAMSREWSQLRLLRLRRNAGHQAALTAGLDNSRGDWIVTMDADLQDPPELIPEMLTAALHHRVDVVYGVRADRRSDSMFKRSTASLYYRIMRRAAGVEVPQNAGDFRLISAAVVREISALPERGRVYRLLIPYLGFRSTTVEYRREPRVAGTSKYPLVKMVKLAADSYLSFTSAPLRFATWLGLFGFLVCTGFTVFALGAWVNGSTLPGWTSFAIIIGFIGASQSLFLGLLGEYVARIYTEVQARPRYVAVAEELKVKDTGTGP